jgi:hypothetical protein
MQSKYNKYIKQKNIVLWYVAPCDLPIHYKRFNDPYWL